MIYGYPEIASVGYTEKQLVEENIPYKKSAFPISALGKSVVEDEIDGFVKVLANDNEILGIHVICNHASELAQQLVVAKSTGVSPEKIKETIFAHPTFSEAIHESILGLSKEALHLPPGTNLRI